MQDLNEAPGQFLLYEDALHLMPQHADGVLVLAVHEPAFTEVFGSNVGQMVMRRVRLVVLDPAREVITQGIQ